MSFGNFGKGRLQTMNKSTDKTVVMHILGIAMVT